MRIDTPKDIPTHLLVDPEQYITKAGRFLRKTSLDELPQILNILKGDMSIIGPRPALWNQYDLIEERDKYGANDVMPGLTGWAQINGRDELEIPVKARLDGEYVKKLQQGGITALFFDVRCFWRTLTTVIKSDGVVEGGTGYIHLKEELNVGFKDYGYLKYFNIDLSENNKRKVLITGAGSYIGESFEKWAKEYYCANFAIDTLDMRDESWRRKNFSCYDTVFHVAGIAHADVGKASEEEKQKYYKVNTELAIETAQKAKAEGVGQFVFMSSMIIYGDSMPLGKEMAIDEHTIPAPANFYGDSKWQADKGVRLLADERFHVAVLRPPMVYGKGSKGNYRILAKLARKLPVFPDVKNKRSILYIDNLCEFLCKLILSGEGGVYFPQNREYSTTSELVSLIGKTSRKNVKLNKAFTPAVTVAKHIPGKVGRLAQKAFGSSWYDQKISCYNGLDYHKYNLKQSIERTERNLGNNTAVNMNTNTKLNLNPAKKPHILVISQYFYPETFRINDMASEWVKRGYRVTVLTGIPNYPMGRFFEGYSYSKRRYETWKGVKIIRIPVIPRGSSNIGMVMNYCSFVISGWCWKMVNRLNADLVFTFEVSPMTQAMIGCWCAKKFHVPHYLYVTDLWPENVESVTGIHSKIVITPIQWMVDYIYRHTDRILTSSQSFVKKIEKRGVSSDKIEFWPQYAEDFFIPIEKSGNLLPQDGVLNLVFAGSVGFAQGLDILVKAALVFKKEELVIRFNIIGDGRYLEELKKKISVAQVECYFNFIPRKPVEEIPQYLAHADALLLTLSKSNVFAITLPAKTQSYFACGKPIIVSADGEIQDVINDAQAGICSNAEDVTGLVKSIKRFMEMKEEEREQMGINALKYSHSHFDKERLMGRLDKIFGLKMDRKVV